MVTTYNLGHQKEKERNGSFFIKFDSPLKPYKRMDPINVAIAKQIIVIIKSGPLRTRSQAEILSRINSASSPTVSYVFQQMLLYDVIEMMPLGIAVGKNFEIYRDDLGAIFRLPDNPIESPKTKKKEVEEGKQVIHFHGPVNSGPIVQSSASKTSIIEPTQIKKEQPINIVKIIKFILWFLGAIDLLSIPKLSRFQGSLHHPKSLLAAV